MEDQSSSISPSVNHPRLCPPACKMLASRKDEFVKKHKFLGQVLEELLLDYSKQHPWEPCKAKIANMTNHVIVKDNIAWLEVTVNNWKWLVVM